MCPEQLFNKAAIIGVGLIGGSMGLAINQKSLAKEILGIGRNIDALQKAVESKAIHSAALDYSGLIDCDLVIIGTPVSTTINLLSTIAPYLKPGAIVTDVGSSKVQVLKHANEQLTKDIIFIGGHPMAGSEKGGFEGADPYLFENAFYVLTPEPDTPEESLDKLIEFVKGLGSRPIIMDAEAHDLSVAVVSHLPHLLAATLVNSLFDFEDASKMSLLAAGGFRDTTRIAASSPDMWRDIFITNREFVLQAINIFKDRLDEIQKVIDHKDEDSIHLLLDRARKLKIDMPINAKGYLPQLWEIVVTVPDRPGIIGYMANILGNEGINIYDIEILRVREGEGGTIRLAFASEEQQKKAVALLTKAGIPTK